MKSKRILCSLILTLLLTAALVGLNPAAAYAAGPNTQVMAASLRELGLFIGTDQGFELDKPCDRLMGAVILTRLLGQENAALTGVYSHPFSDVAGSYADPYIGFLYQKGLINGISAESYGTSVMSGQQFATLALRALGYQDSVDFQWNTALTSLIERGLLTKAEADWVGSGEFLRQHAVLISYRAMLSKIKDNSYTLAYRLLWSDVFNTRQLARSKDIHLLLAADMPDYMGFVVTVASEKQFRDIVWQALLNRQSNLALFAPSISPERGQALIDELLAPYFARDFYDVRLTVTEDGVYNISGYISEYMSMQFYYESPHRYSKNYQFYDPAYQQLNEEYISMYMWRDKIDSIVSTVTNPEMSEYDRVKALHDYIVRNTEFDDTADNFSSSHFADGVLFDGWGVCDGYASALKMLLNGAGIECLVVFGSAPEGNHAWNQVKIDGVWYNVDVTWADTIGRGDIYYGYFCLPDSAFLSNHKPEKPEITHTCDTFLSYPQS